MSNPPLDEAPQSMALQEHFQEKTENVQAHEPEPSRDASLSEQATRVDDTSARDAKVSRTTLHVGLSVRGALRWPLKNLRNMVSDENGDRLTPRETREWLLDQLSHGVEMLSFGGCDNFDPKTGCGGHAKTGAEHV